MPTDGMSQTKNSVSSINPRWKTGWPTMSPLPEPPLPHEKMVESDHQSSAADTVNVPVYWLSAPPKAGIEAQTAIAVGRQSLPSDAASAVGGNCTAAATTLGTASLWKTPWRLDIWGPLPRTPFIIYSPEAVCFFSLFSLLSSIRVLSLVLQQFESSVLSSSFALSFLCSSCLPVVLSVFCLTRSETSHVS